MATVYRRCFKLKDSRDDVEVADFWRFMLEEAARIVQKVKGVNAIRYYSAAGALRADCISVIEMDDAARSRHAQAARTPLRCHRPQDVDPVVPAPGDTANWSGR